MSASRTSSSRSIFSGISHSNSPTRSKYSPPPPPLPPLPPRSTLFQYTHGMGQSTYGFDTTRVSSFYSFSSFSWSIDQVCISVRVLISLQDRRSPMSFPLFSHFFSLLSLLLLPSSLPVSPFVYSSLPLLLSAFHVQEQKCEFDEYII